MQGLAQEINELAVKETIRINNAYEKLIKKNVRKS